ncbi:MAG: GTPase HflX [Deltaproteobacteria bacterium]|nr:GTPase HflX [Deltaproteobacteria bacterium]MCB9787388.1 GTPase HflX [Deltaproteobacteria bacterium]
MSAQLSGHTTGLKPAQRHALERIFRRTVPATEVITAELAGFMAQISREIRRQVAVILDRRGHVQFVVVGDAQKLMLPDLGRHRAGRGRFRGLRVIHTVLSGERLDRDDLTDLTLLQLDLMGVIDVDAEGRAASLEVAHLVPPRDDATLWEVLPPRSLHGFALDFRGFIEDLEGQFAAYARTQDAGDGATLAVAVHLATGERDPEESLSELRELARTANVHIVETLVQRRREPDPRYVIGRGKLEQLVLASMQRGAELIIFDRDLTPAQARSIADATEAKVIDRTQLILDIFAQRASSRDGKLQVELAQLKYLLPRLVGRSTALSRLAGGIGGRGPGETKLEVDRRRAKDRLSQLQRQIDGLSRERAHRRARRVRSHLPVVAIVGYTNAGKSTLLNTLTGADVVAEDKLFATLDPTARRLTLPTGELVLTDTVGFIRDLPEDLVAAFKATLEELSEADALLHVVDISTPDWEARMEAVGRVLGELEVHEKPQIVVFNKADAYTGDASLDALCRRVGAVPTSAMDRQTLGPLLERLAPLARRAQPWETAPPLPDAQAAT